MQLKLLRELEAYTSLAKVTIGDHINLKMPNGRIITLRAKGEVKVGRLKDAIREAGLTAEQFLKLLQ